MPVPNPPIPGHHLVNEGHVFRLHHVDQFPSTSLFAAEEPQYSGGCQCGARPPDFPNVSTNAMKAWHRTHKEELRGVHRVDRVRLLHQVLDDAEEALRLGDYERMTKVIFVWSQRREHLLAGEETWEDQHI
jgi:hypothetical protein